VLTALHFTQHGLRPTAYDSVEHGAWSMALKLRGHKSIRYRFYSRIE